MSRNPHCYSFASFLITTFKFKKFNIFLISSVSSFEIITAVIPDPRIFFWGASSVADAATVNANGANTLLANGGTLQFQIIVPPPLINFWIFCRPLPPPPSPNPLSYLDPRLLIFRVLFCRYFRDC